MEKELIEIDFKTEFTKEFKEDIFLKARNIEGLIEFLREMASADIRRYFNAATEEQRYAVKGAYYRTMKLQELIIGKK